MSADLSFLGPIRFWQRNLRIFRKMFLGALPNNFVEPALYLLALGFGFGTFVREIDGMPYLDYVATGIVASAVMFGATFECTYNAFVEFYYDRSYDAILTTPLSAEDIGVGELLWGATRATMYGSAFLIVVAAFGVMRSPWALALAAVFFLGGLLFAILALTFTAVNPFRGLFHLLLFDVRPTDVPVQRHLLSDVGHAVLGTAGGLVHAAVSSRGHQSKLRARHARSGDRSPGMADWGDHAANAAARDPLEAPFNALRRASERRSRPSFDDRAPTESAARPSSACAVASASSP